jgi:hypothetical protein
MEGLPAHRAGLRPGDRIISAEGRPVGSWQELVNVIQTRPGQSVPLTIERAGDRLELVVTPESRAPTDGGENVGQIGVVATVPVEQPGILGALRHGADQTWFYTSFTVEFLGDLVTGGASPRNVGGPILIGQLSGEVARLGVRALLDPRTRWRTARVPRHRGRAGAGIDPGTAPAADPGRPVVPGGADGLGHRERRPATVRNLAPAHQARANGLRVTTAGPDDACPGALRRRSARVAPSARRATGHRRSRRGRVPHPPCRTRAHRRCSAR